jgi:hypothetical protein
VTFEETIAKSEALDRALSRPLEIRMPEIAGSTKIVGDLTSMFSDLRRDIMAAVTDAKTDVAAAGAELVEEVKGLKVMATALRAETKNVRDFKTQILGNATGGENAEDGEAAPK